jgi:branched-chain amino acid transport system substrate-binding protein
VMTVAGLEKGVGIITADYRKDPVDPQWQDDPAMKEWRAFMAKYYPEGDIRDNSNVYGYAVAQTLVQTLKQCGDNLTRENVMKQAASLDLTSGLLAPGIKITTSPTDFYPIKQMRLQKFDGKSWVPFGEAIGS